MAPRKKVNPPMAIDSIKHGDKRANLPTADAQEFVTPQVEEARQIIVERNPSLDPQLVWRGKYGDESASVTDGSAALEADAPPIYIQEKVDPRLLVEDLRRTATSSGGHAEPTLFDTFDGLDELDLVDFYRHQANWSNRMILGDSLQVMGSLAEREEMREQVQAVYFDPPYGIKFGSNWQASVRKRDVKDGKVEDAAREVEQIKAFRDTWELGIHSYLSYLRDRLLVSRELLTESGSCFVQIGDENVHLVRSLMDEVFGSENFVSQIVFKKTAGATSRYISPTVDHIVWFAKEIDRLRYHSPLRARSGLSDADASYAFVDVDGERRRMTDREQRELDPLPSAGRVYRQQILTSPRVRANRTGYFPVEVDGRTFLPTTGEWKTHREGIRNLVLAGRVQASERSLSYVRYLDDFPAVEVSNLWEDTQTGSGMQKIYVVQSSAKVVQRCILMCTNPGDLVLDPTCGSGTTAYVAEQWGRRWITIDTSRVALALARQRLMGARFPYYLLADSEKGRAKEGDLNGRVLPPATTSGNIRHGFVYERVQHVTLKSIANNPDIREGISHDEIEAAIKRHADLETLYDRPYEDKQTVRVTGPFTVESLNPNRSLAFAGGPDDAERETISERNGAQQPDGPNFEQSILDNLARAGVQNGRRDERIEFASTESYPGTFIQAMGDSKDGARIGISIGPQYGTVSQRFVKEAAREAIAEGSIDLLCVLGFAFDATAGDVTGDDNVTVDTSRDGFASVAGERNLGRIKVLMVRMNVDLLMGEDLKKTGAGNLFTVFGEPDLQIDTTDDDVVVHLNGVDVYDPTTGQVRSNDPDQIALWMIDTEYNGDSFFVRHCYFTGGNDPYKRLKTALKADIDAEAWATLYATDSRPFPKPASGKIAVKVINDYGDEVMKVFEVT